MTDLVVHHLKVRGTDDALFQRVARLVTPPPTELEKSAFVPAYAGFNIADGSDVDISYYYAPPTTPLEFRPKTRFDRHLRTEELWIVMTGDFLLPLAACRRPDDPGDLPRREDFSCFVIRQGDMFVLRPNVWHCGPWPSRPGTPVRFLMLLSGHRKRAAGPRDFVDFYQRDFPEGIGILPDFVEADRSC